MVSEQERTYTITRTHRSSLKIRDPIELVELIEETSKYCTENYINDALERGETFFIVTSEAVYTIKF